MLERLAGLAFDAVLAGPERGALGSLRARLLADVDGHVVVLGAGSGTDLRHLPHGVTRCTLVEPSAPMRERLAGAVPPHLADRTEIVDAFGESLPLTDGEADHVVLSLVLCSVRDTAAVAAELHRVLRPGGTVRVLEHGATDHELGHRVQVALNPLWRRVVVGCNLDRDVTSALGDHFDTSDLGPARVPLVSRIGRVTSGVAVRR